MKIIPAILPMSYRAIQSGIEKVHNVVDTVQIDFVDGHFASNRTWWFNNKDEDRLTALLNQDEGMPEWETMNYEFDLMVKNPLEYIDTFVALGPSKIIFHLESLDQATALAYFKQLPTIVTDVMTFGIAISLDTDPSLIAPYVSFIDTIQCMGIAKVGYQGHAFDARALDLVAKTKALYPDKMISVDGGVTFEAAPLLVQAGATSLVVGSAIFQSDDVHGTIKKFKTICHQANSAQEN